MKFGDFDDLWVGGDRRGIDVQGLNEKIAEGLEFWFDSSEFIDGGVVVVGGLDGLPAVGAVGEAEVGAAVEEVEAEGEMAVEEPLGVFDLGGDGFLLAVRAADVVGPDGVPGGVNFGAVDGESTGDFLGESKFCRVRQAVGGAEDSGHALDDVPDRAAVVAGVKLRVESGIDENLAKIVEVFVDVGVFVFDLDHEDRAAVRDLQVADLIVEGRHVALAIFHERLDHRCGF